MMWQYDSHQPKTGPKSFVFFIKNFGNVRVWWESVTQQYKITLSLGARHYTPATAFNENQIDEALNFALRFARAHVSKVAQEADEQLFAALTE